VDIDKIPRNHNKLHRHSAAKIWCSLDSILLILKQLQDNKLRFTYSFS